MVGVASQLELLEGFHQVNQKKRSGMYEKDAGFSSEDEVEIPDFHDKRNLGFRNTVDGNAISLKREGPDSELDEWISGDEGSRMLFNSVIAGATVSHAVDFCTRGKAKQFEPCGNSAVDKDVSRVLHVGEDARCSALRPLYSKDKYPAKGGRRKPKTRSSSHYQPHQKGAFCLFNQKDKDPNSTSANELLDEPEGIECWPLEKSPSEFLGSCGGDRLLKSSLAPPVEAAIQTDHSRTSVVELLDNLGGKNRSLHMKSKMVGRRKGRMGQHAVIRKISSSGKDVRSDEDLCEFMHSGSSSDNEEKAQNSELAIVESKRKTMADKFHEAFGSASMNDSRPSITVAKQLSSGLFGRLQQVMQRQKEQDTEFLKKLQTEVWPKDEARCIDVKILSRSFDAKLTVCQSSLLENVESSIENAQKENFGKIWTIIFNSRVCGDVDLEVRNFVRIHPPWKEVQVRQVGEIIILASYFSQIYT